MALGALLNAVYEADGRVQSRILFLLDEVARLGPMAALEAARRCRQGWGLTLLLLCQSLGQLAEQLAAREFGSGTTAPPGGSTLPCRTPRPRELPQVCGEHGVIASSEADSRATLVRSGGVPSDSSE